MEEIAAGIFVETNFRRVTVGAILTDGGFVLIDTPPFPREAQFWRETLAEISDKPILAIVNTDGHRDRILGNGWFETSVIVAHDETIAQFTNLPSNYLENAINTLTDDPVERNSFSGMRLRPPTVGFSHRMQLRYGGWVIPLLAMPGPTAGNVWVHLPDERVLFAGDSVVMNQHLHISSTTTKQWLESLTNLRRERFAADQVVTGRGGIADKSMTETLSNYLRLARRRVHSLYRAGRPRADTSTLVAELIDLFPYAENDVELIQRRIKTGLDRIYEEFKASEQPDGAEEEQATGGL